MSAAVDNPLELHEVPAMLDYYRRMSAIRGFVLGMGLRDEFGELAFDALR